MRLWKLCAALAPVALGLAVSSAANATILLGNTVNYDYGFTPLGGFAYVGPSEGNYLVGPGIEIPNVEGVATMDLSDTNILIDFTQTNNWTPTTFNGFRLSDVFSTIPAITSVTINGATNLGGFSASNISFDDNSITVNWQGLSFNTNTIVSLDINAVAVPEPLTLSLFGAGIIGAVGFGRRKSKNKA